MAGREFEAEVHIIYEPDMARMVKALRILLESKPKRKEGEKGVEAGGKEKQAG